MSVALVGACGSGGDPGQPSLEHVHGLGVSPADGMLCVASHHGVFRVDGEGDAEQIAGRSQDFMGFTIVACTRCRLGRRRVRELRSGR